MFTIEENNLYYKIQNVKLHNKINSTEKNYKKEKSRYAKYINLCNKKIEKQNTLIEQLKKENEQLKNDYNKIPKFIKWIFVRKK